MVQSTTTYVRYRGAVNALHAFTQATHGAPPPDIVNQIPIGLAISKFGVRKTLLVCSIVATIGSLAFALAPQLWMIHVGRLLVGWGVSSVFLSFVAVAKEYFHPSSASTAMGCTMAVGIAGGILAQVCL